MVWLPDGEKNSKISLFVLAQLTNVTDGQTDRQTDGHHRVTALYRAYAYASRGKNCQTRLSPQNLWFCKQVEQVVLCLRFMEEL